MTGPLEQAATELDAGRPVAALESLLAAWRETPVPAVADVIGLLSLEIDRSLPAIQGSEHEVHTAWLDIAAKRRPEDVGRLLATTAKCGMARMRKRFELWKTFPPDPRIAPALLKILSPRNAAVLMPFWTIALGIATASGDPRIPAILDEVTTLLPRRGTLDTATVRKRIDKAREAIKPIDFALDPAEVVALDRCRHALRRLAALPAPPPETILQEPTTKAPDHGTGAQLLEAILTHPDDFGARQVYGDFLLERGDVRGELITLQCKERLTPAEQRRERELLKAHALEWTRPLDAALKRDRIRFVGGFLGACEVRFATKNQRELIGHPLWATVIELDTKHMDLVLDPCMRSMRRATPSPAALSKLAARKEPVLLEAAIGHARKLPDGRYVSCGMGVQPIAAWARALDVGALVNLRKLDLGVYGAAIDDLGWLLDSRLGRQLTELELSGGAYPVGSWKNLLDRTPTLQRLVLSLSGKNDQLVIERDRLTLRTAGYFVDWDAPTRARWIDSVFGGFPKSHKVIVEFVGKNMRRRHSAGWGEMTLRLRERFEAVEERT